MLSEVQKKAVQHHEGQLIIISCPGSGKTTTVIARVADMVESGIDPSSILVVTFSKKAADEMGERYQKSGADGNVTFSTIHSFCNRVITEDLGMKPEMLLSDDMEKMNRIAAAVRQLMKSGELKTEIRDMGKFVSSCLLEIGLINNNPYHEWDGYKSKNYHDAKVFRKIYQAYEDWKNEAGLYDYDDMLKYTYEAFLNKKEILEKYKAIYKYLIIDEFQDTNDLQKEILYMLAGENPNLCVVGDDDQSIYRFRGAKPEIMLSFKDQFPDCTALYMDVNYRSEPKIIACAKNLISYNTHRFPKNIVSAKSGSGTVQFLPTYDTKLEEEQHIAEKIEEVHASGIPYENMAVLFRNNQQVQGLMRACMERNIPAVSPEVIRSIYKEWIFTDIVKYWKLAKGNRTPELLKAVINKPNRYIPYRLLSSADEKDILEKIRTGTPEDWKRKRQTESIQKFFRNLDVLKDLGPSDFLSYLFKQMRYESYVREYASQIEQNFEEFAGWMDFYKKEAADFSTFEEWSRHIAKYNLEMKELSERNKESGVTLMTMHKSKGLEWDVVFVSGVNERIIPSRQAENVDDMEEERRLLYVAVTRAKEQLYIASSGTRSRFVPQMLEEKGLKLNPLSKDRSFETEKNMSAVIGNNKIKKKAKVRHRELGRGFIADIQGNDVVIKFDDSIGLHRMRKDDFSNGSLILL